LPPFSLPWLEPTQAEAKAQDRVGPTALSFPLPLLPISNQCRHQSGHDQRHTDEVSGDTEHTTVILSPLHTLAYHLPSPETYNTHRDDSSDTWTSDEVAPSIAVFSDDYNERYTLLIAPHFYSMGQSSRIEHEAHLTIAMALGQAVHNGYTTFRPIGHGSV
jgi:hypothetical protein